MSIPVTESSQRTGKTLLNVQPSGTTGAQLALNIDVTIWLKA
jgi:hypothetical protein